MIQRVNHVSHYCATSILLQKVRSSACLVSSSPTFVRGLFWGVPCDDYSSVSWWFLFDLLSENGFHFRVLLFSPSFFFRIRSFYSWKITLFQRIRDRTNTLVRFIGIAKALYDMKNFNGLMGILVGLSLSPVSRLKHTWSKVPSKHQEVLHPSLEFCRCQYWNPK